MLARLPNIISKVNMASSFDEKIFNLITKTNKYAENYNILIAKYALFSHEILYGRNGDM